MSSPEENIDRSSEHTRNCCKFKYSIRWFHSKSALLVLTWNLLISASVLSLYRVYEPIVFGKYGLFNRHFSWIPGSVMFLALIISTPLAGWLADARLGNCRVFRAGCVFLFFAVVLGCIFILIPSNDYTNVVTDSIVSFTGCVGIVLWLVTSLQVGLDQIPDASATNITSFIAWFVFSVFSGCWISDAVLQISFNCVNFVSVSSDNFIQICSLFPVICMAIVLCLDFFLSPKWLIIEPKSPQSLKLIFQVLKFAKKHKAPVDRSALTYWEEDIPSRIDIGKSKYGGPFTTEQVEDVKTILKLLVVTLPLWMVLPSVELLQRLSTPVLPGFNDCTSNSLYFFSFNIFWCVVLGTPVYEFVIYPFVKNKLPSILKRIGIAAFLLVLINITYLILSVFQHFHIVASNYTIWLFVVQQIILSFFSLLFLPSLFEFACAQSPYNMRTLLVGYLLSITVFCFFVSNFTNVIVEKLCKSSPYCSIIDNSLASGLGVIGFLLHCILARWYKRRERDDIYSPHIVVEEVYDRYLSAQPQIDFSNLTDSQ